MKIEVFSEDDAWETLSKLLNGELTIESIDDLDFGTWVKSSIYIPGERYDSALNTYMMQGWLDAQRSLYRSYAIAAKGAADGRSLTDLERDKLEIVVKVKSGSSDQEAELQDVLKEAVLAAVGKMEPTQIAIVLIVAILSWAGVVVTRTWLNKRTEERLAEIGAKEKSDANSLLGQAFAALQEVATDKQKTAMLKQAEEMLPIVKTFETEADVARHSLVKHSSQMDSKVNGVEIPAILAQRVTREPRSEYLDERRDGNYRIQKVDTTVPDGFRVYVENLESGETFAADVQEVISSLKDREVIRDAEWSKVPVRLQINTKIKRGVVQQATILRAEPADSSSEPATNPATSSKDG